MSRVIYKVLHSSGVVISVATFALDGGAGLDVLINDKPIIRAYNPSEVTAWFQHSSGANTENWRAAYHASGLGEADFKRPNPISALVAADYKKLVPAPSRTSINAGLSPAPHALMMSVFGAPGALTRDCSSVNSHLAAKLTTLQATPNFRLYGFKPFATAVASALEEIKTEHPALYDIIGSAGVTCCRAVRGSTTHFSNHSWGTAWDVTIGGILAPLNATRIPYGLFPLNVALRKQGIFWAAGYNGRTDPMHMEASAQLVSQWDKAGLI